MLRKKGCSCEKTSVSLDIASLHGAPIAVPLAYQAMVLCWCWWLKDCCTTGSSCLVTARSYYTFNVSKQISLRPQQPVGSNPIGSP